MCAKTNACDLDFASSEARAGARGLARTKDHLEPTTGIERGTNLGSISYSQEEDWFGEKSPSRHTVRAAADATCSRFYSHRHSYPRDRHRGYHRDLHSRACHHAEILAGSRSRAALSHW